MKIYRPIRSNNKGQAFGASKACVQLNASGNPIRPFRVIAKPGFLCPIGYTSFYEVIGLLGHNGEDWSAYHGEPSYFEVDAEDPAVQWYSKEASDLEGGLGVDVYSKGLVYLDKLPMQAGPQAREFWKTHDRKIRVKFRKWHFKDGVKDTDVKMGELLGHCDNTGSSSGDHLHKSMKFVDEFDQTMDTDNGYDGAVDESIYYVNKFVLDVLGLEEEKRTLITKLIATLEKLKVVLELLAKKYKKT